MFKAVIIQKPQICRFSNGGKGVACQGIVAQISGQLGNES